MHSKKPVIVVTTILGIFVIYALVSYFNHGFVYSIVAQDTQTLITKLQSYGPLAALVLLALVIVEVVAAPIPPLILYIVAGIMFGSFGGGTLVLIGNLIGASIAFLIAKKISTAYLNKKIGKEKQRKFNQFTEKYGIYAIFLLRINPLTSSDIFSYLAGLSNMKLSHFLLATALGLAPLIYLQTYLGSTLIQNNPFLLLLFLIISVIYAAIIIFYTLKFLTKNKNNK